MKTIFKRWLPMAFVITVLFGAVYLCLQQTIRQGYNWPQINAVNDVSFQLSHATAQDKALAPYATTPIDQTGSLFVILYNDNGQAIQSSAQLDGGTPAIPLGVLKSSDSAPAYHAVTWQPKSDVRIAAVVERINQDNKVIYVVAGRNLAQPEQLTSSLLFLCSVGWLGAVSAALLLIAIFEPKTRERLRRRSYPN